MGRGETPTKIIAGKLDSDVPRLHTVCVPQGHALCLVGLQQAPVSVGSIMP